LAPASIQHGLLRLALRMTIVLTVPDSALTSRRNARLPSLLVLAPMISALLRLRLAMPHTARHGDARMLVVARTLLRLMAALAAALVAVASLQAGRKEAPM
jgi:hypothetical protein